MKREKRLYQSYFREFEELAHKGCKLYYPREEMISPKKLAKTMVHDPMHSYMRDPQYNEKGEVVRIEFSKVQ